MKEIILSSSARQTLDEYFDAYIGHSGDNDMWKRAFNYSRILSCLFHIEAHVDTPYIIDGRNFIIINGVATVEYIETDAGVLVQEISFCEV